MKEFASTWEEAKGLMYPDALEAVESCKERLSELTAADLENLALVVYREGLEHGWEAYEDMLEYHERLKEKLFNEHFES